MDGKEIIQTLMRLNNVKNYELANVLGISQPALSDRLNKKKTNNMTIATINAMLNGIETVCRMNKQVCPGYDVIIVPRTTKINGSSYLIEDGQTENSSNEETEKPKRSKIKKTPETTDIIEPIKKELDSSKSIKKELDLTEKPVESPKESGPRIKLIKNPTPPDVADVADLGIFP